MVLLVVSLLFFSLLHMVAITQAADRAKLINKIGLLHYKIAFAILSLISLFLATQGWQTAGEDMLFLYDAPSWGKHVNAAFTLIGFILFIASRAPTNIRRIIRHPQLTGVTAWAVGHLFANGELRSVALFGIFAIWSHLAMHAINRRDGSWKKPEKFSLAGDVITVLLAFAAYGGFAYIHADLFGVRPW